MKIQYKGIASEICRKIQKYKNEMFRLRHRSGSSAFGPRDVLDSSMSMQVSAEDLSGSSKRYTRRTSLLGKRGNLMYLRYGNLEMALISKSNCRTISVWSFIKDDKASERGR